MTGTLTYEVRRVRGPGEMAAALDLRHDVFCIEQGVPEHEELDGRDHEGIHLVAVSGDQLLATCRVLMVGSTAQFSRLAVQRSARRRGIATSLLALADEEVRAAGGRRIVLHAQTYARTLYELAGYRTRGRMFTEAGIEHIAMEKSHLSAVPEVRVDPLSGQRTIVAGARAGRPGGGWSASPAPVDRRRRATRSRRATRTGPRPSSTPCARAAAARTPPAGRCASSPTCTRRSTPSRPSPSRRPTAICSGPARPAAATR